MAVRSVEITSPVNGAVVSLTFSVAVNVWRDGNPAIMVLVAVEQVPPTNEDDPWDELSPGYWQVCTQDSQLHFHCNVSRAAGAYFVRARASITKLVNHNTIWIDWTADAQRIEITARA
jgi:hypothetical protein